MHIQTARAFIFSLFIYLVVSQSDSISMECRQQISDFLSVCDATNARQSLQGFQNQLDGSLAMCCYSNDCCSRLDSIKDCLTCDFAGDTNSLNVNLLQSLGYHSTICQSEFQLPECFVQQSQNQASQDRCALQSFNLILECGFLAQTGNQKEDGFSCCWPTECCEKSQNLLSSECNSDCATDQATPINTFGNMIARMWRKVCLAPENIETCSVSQVMSANTQQSNSQVPRIVQQDAGQSQDGINLNVQQVSTQALDPQCMDIFDRAQIDDLFVVLQNLDNFCGDTFQSDNIPILNLCCDAIQQITSIMCEYYECASQPAQFFNQSVAQLVLQWINPNSPTPLCPNAQTLQSTCNVANALNVVVSTPTPTPSTTPTPTPNNAINLRASNLVNFNISQMALVLSSIPKDQLLDLRLAAFDQLRESIREYNWTTLELLGQLPLYADFYAELATMQLEDRLVGFPVTVFAINSTTLEDIRINVPDYFSSDWNRTILSHVVLGYTLGENFVDGMEQSLQTLAGYFVNAKQVDENRIIIQGCCSEQNIGTHISSIKTSDGALWIIDGNIYPPGVAEKIYN